MRFYAQADDLVPNWLDEVPTGVERLIRIASLLVEDRTRLARYPVDADGYPTKPAHVQAFRDATCCQIAEWVSAKIDPTKGTVGQTPTVSSQSAGGGSVSYINIPTLAEIAEAVTTLSPNAEAILRSVGLTRANVGYLR